MNKTVNINLANVLFHIDEDAYNKMRRYLESVKRSFANTPGSDEIIADIEARIAELFHEKLANERQVITNKEVDEVITIMGQPEDYMVDEDIFEDEPKSNYGSEKRKSKKLYRDIDQKYVAGVSSGLAHYFNIDPIWVRLLWILLTLGSSGGFILIYGLLWILIPEAATTSQKLDMRGEDINISNIERKVKEGFEGVADKIKNVDYEGVGNKVKNSSKTFFDTIGDIIMFFFKIFGKFIGIILIIIGAATIIGMFIGMLTVGALDWVSIPGFDQFINSTTNSPIWLLSLLTFFAVCIPFFFLLYLGLKILVTNLKSIGNIAKFSLLGLWLISIIALIVIGVREAASHAFSGNVTIENELYLENPSDTLNIKLAFSEFYEDDNNIRLGNAILIYDKNGNPMLQSEDIRYNIRKADDTQARITVRKEANGPSREAARETAKKIEYDYSMQGNTLILDGFLTSSENSKFNDQEARINIYLPVGTLVNYIPSERRNGTFRAATDRDMDGLQGYIWKMGADGELKCQDCPPMEEVDDEGDNSENRIRINENGIDININDKDGESFKMKINEDGVRIKANDNDEESVDINIDAAGNAVNIKAKDGDTIVTRTISNDEQK